MYGIVCGVPSAKMVVIVEPGAIYNLAEQACRTISMRAQFIKLMLVIAGQPRQVISALISSKMIRLL